MKFIFLIFLLFSFPSFAAEEKKDDCYLCTFKHNLCVSGEKRKSVHLEDKACFDEASTWYKLSYIDCSKDISYAWRYLHKSEIYGGPEPEEAKRLIEQSKKNLIEHEEFLEEHTITIFDMAGWFFEGLKQGILNPSSSEE